LRGLGLDRIRAAQVLAQSRLPRDRGHLALLQESFSYLRRFVPRVLDAVDFAGTDGDLLAAVAVLRDLYAKGRRNVPGDAPTSFVPARWLGYLEQAQRDGDATGYRHYWELCVLYGLRDGLRSGDVHVPGSRRYADPAEYLLDADRWGQLREEYCAQNGKPRAASEAIELARAELHSALDDLEAVLAAGDGPVRLDDDGALIIGRLTAESVPDEAEALLDDLAAMLPRIPLAALLIELDRRCRKGIVTGTAADAAPSTLGLTGITDERTPSTTP
jgi:hypothetical protein